MSILRHDGLTLRIGSATKPPEDQRVSMHERYMIEHEHPDCSLETYETEVLHQYYCGRRGDTFGHYDMTPDGGKVVGHISFWTRPIPVDALSAIEGRPLVRSTIEAEIGWAIRLPEREKGYATRGARCILDHAFGEMNLNRVIAIADSQNAASVRVMQKLGMTTFTYSDGEKTIGVATP